MAKVKIKVGEVNGVWKSNGVWVDGVEIPCSSVVFQADRNSRHVVLQIVPSEIEIEAEGTEITKA